MTSLASVVAFDYFFTQPYHSLRIDSPSDLWAAGLLLVIATMVSVVAAQARRRALDAARAADRGSAVQEVAHLVLTGAPAGAVDSAAARALTHIFRAPSVVFAEQAGRLEVRAQSGDALLSSSDHEAARWPLGRAVGHSDPSSQGARAPFRLDGVRSLVSRLWR